MIWNAWREPLEFELPDAPWRRWIDTALDSPDDIVEWQSAPAVPGRRYRAGARSVVALITSSEN
jgi:glycogen operon protein